MTPMSACKSASVAEGSKYTSTNKTYSDDAHTARATLTAYRLAKTEAILSRIYLVDVYSVVLVYCTATRIYTRTCNS